jgi:hypothetical protein
LAADSYVDLSEDVTHGGSVQPHPYTFEMWMTENGDETTRRRIRLLGLALALSVALAGCGLTGGSVQSHGAIVAPSAAAPVRVADPVAIDIPQINAHSTLIPLGLNTDPALGPIGSPAVPSVHTPKLAGYYARGGVKAGRPGPPLVVIAHVNGDGQQGLFYHLKDLRPGDIVQVKLADKTELTFRITLVESDPKTAFPGQEVFGPTDHATLRAVTCGGEFDPKARSYKNNITAYADLVA